MKFFPDTVEARGDQTSGFESHTSDDYRNHYTPEGIRSDTGSEAKLFDTTETLRTIQQAAHSRLVTPWAVLGAVLARVVAEVPPHIVLPPLVGSDASLNLAVGLVADSGGGKSGATGCARDVLRIHNRRAQDIGPGSGEGLIAAFLDRDPDTKENVVKTDPLALLLADEIAQIGVVQGRASQASFGPIVRSMLTGGAASTSAADKERRRHLPANSYRLTVVAGIQPKLSDVLLGDSDAGTPQRWLWLPADDPEWDVPFTEWPTPITWELPSTAHLRDPDGFVRIRVPEVVRQAVYAARVRRLRREGDPLDGHRLLMREKAAAALALLHGELDITEWWAPAGMLMHRSDLTRAYCANAVVIKAKDESRAQGRLAAERETGAREARTDEARRHAAAIWRTVSAGMHSNAKHDPDAGCTSRCIAHALRHHKGADKNAATEAAIELEWIEERDGRYFPGQAQPAQEAA